MRHTEANSYAGGDYYPIVRSWMVKLKVDALDIRANALKLSEGDARLYVAAVMGSSFLLRFRVMRGSMGRGGHRYITLNKKSPYSLGLVLHECAHAIQGKREHEQLMIRRQLRAAGKIPTQSLQRASHHGEAFCRTYARLLREVM